MGSCGAMTDMNLIGERASRANKANGNLLGKCAVYKVSWMHRSCSEKKGPLYICKI